MSISFHCESCKKKIKAPDEAGGKWGSCPHCKHRCYIPSPPPADGQDELKLSPIDESDETKYNQMMRETHGLTRNILKENAPLDNSREPKSVADATGEKALIKNIVIYLRLIADGELEQAEKIEPKIISAGTTAKRILQQMTKAEKPEPELADIVPKVLKSLIKTLYAKL